MLKTRVLTAIVILPVVLGLLFAGSDRARRPSSRTRGTPPKPTPCGS